MKNTKLLVVILIIVSILLTGIIFYAFQYQTKTIKSFFNNDLNKIDKIDIMNGNDGNIVEVVDKKVISDISDYLSKLRFKRIYSQKSTGWNYRFFIYQNNNQVLEITFMGEEQCIFKNNGIKYNISKFTNVTSESLYNEAIKAIPQ